MEKWRPKLTPKCQFIRTNTPGGYVFRALRSPGGDVFHLPGIEALIMMGLEILYRTLARALAPWEPHHGSSAYKVLKYH